MIRRTLTTLALVAVMATLTAASSAPCEKVKGTGNTQAVSETAFAGTATFDDGRTAFVNTQLLGQPRESGDGTLHAQTSHTFTFEDGSSVTTVDRAVLSPVSQGVYRLNTQATISSGTGDYADACGRMNMHGTISFVTGKVDWRFSGQICECD